MNSRRFFLILPFAALATLAAVAFKQTQTYPDPHSFVPPGERRSAPAFEAYDVDNQLVKFQRYLGRHEILLAFYLANENEGADTDPILHELQRRFHDLDQRGVVILAVSSALPQWNRKALARLTEERKKAPESNDEQSSEIISKDEKFPFALLSDVTLDIHKMWGRYDEVNQTPLSGVFYIDRAGQVAWKEGKPAPLDNSLQLIERLSTQ